MLVHKGCPKVSSHVTQKMEAPMAGFFPRALVCISISVADSFLKLAKKKTFYTHYPEREPKISISSTCLEHQSNIITCHIQVISVTPIYSEAIPSAE